MSDLARWTIKVPPPHVEPTPRRIRVRAGDTLIADSTKAQLLAWYGPGMLPTYCLPPQDVRTDLFRPSPDRGAPTGDRPTIAYDVVVGDQVVERAARLFRALPPPLDTIEGFWTFTWDRGLSWFEEGLEVHVHAKDPGKRVDTVPSDRHVVVELDGVVLAESRRPHALFETWLPTRWYFPLEDVRQDLLVPSSTVTQCPYKGTASYWSVQVGPTLHEDLAWTYPDPVLENPRIAGLVAFFNEHVDLIIDGVRQERPRTPWSR
jgi:uncharacterized protein (DUF427 family)